MLPPAQYFRIGAFRSRKAPIMPCFSNYGHRKFERPLHIAASQRRVSDNKYHVNLAAAGPYARIQYSLEFFP